VKWYQEDISGTTNPLERPKFSEMLTRLLSNGVRCVRLEKYDRLARSSMWIDWTILKFQERGLELTRLASQFVLTVSPANLFQSTAVWRR
jgi:DNA invertase Pin-like site-specific DNA recombinase